MPPVDVAATTNGRSRSSFCNTNFIWHNLRWLYVLRIGHKEWL